MARSMALRNTSQFNIPVKTDDPGIEVVPRTLWSPPKGLDYLNRKNRIDAQHFPQNMNLWMDRGVLRSRYGTEAVGAASADDDPVVAVINFVTGSGIGFLLRFTITKLQQWDGTNWNNVGVATFTGGVDDYFAYTAFNNTLVFSNGVDGLWEYAPMIGALNLIPEGPNAKHLTTFGGRVIASVVDGFEYRTQWSAKNDSHDWDGIGSGHEDLLSTPGGQVDQVIGVYPITDTVAIMLRTNSAWHMSQTGDPDAPHRFERLYHKLGCRSRHSVDVIPGGVIFLGTDDVYILNDRSIAPIGELVKDRVYTEFTNLSRVRGLYRPRTKEYWMSHGDTVYRYSMVDQGWTRHVYPFDIKWMEESIFHFGGITWDQMVGTWDEQTESWDSLLGAINQPAFYFATSEVDDEDNPFGNVIQEDPEQTDDGHIAEGHTAKGIEIQTGQLLAATPLQDTEMLEAQLEYENTEEQDLVFEYSVDSGTTWTALSTKTCEVTTHPDILRVMKTLARQAFMLRITSTTLGGMTLISFSPFLVVEHPSANRVQGGTP